MIKKIILDTDIGGDPDDMFALLLALNSSEIKIELIVTSDEHKGDRAKFIKKFLSLCGKKIDVVSGIDLGNTKYFLVKYLIKDYKTKVDFDYLEKIKNIVEKNKLTYYVCIGPQSNLAKFIQSYPKLKSKVEIVIMGGGINKPSGKAEHNIHYDIKSAQIVLNSNWKKKYVIADITYRDEIKIEKKSIFFQKLKQSRKPHINYLIKSVFLFFNSLHRDSNMNDPLTLSTLINKDIVIFKKKKIMIDKKGIMKINGKETMISEKADYDLFWKLFENRILK